MEKHPTNAMIEEKEALVQKVGIVKL